MWASCCTLHRNCSEERSAEINFVDEQGRCLSMQLHAARTAKDLHIDSLDALAECRGSVSLAFLSEVRRSSLMNQRDRFVLPAPVLPADALVALAPPIPPAVPLRSRRTPSPSERNGWEPPLPDRCYASPKGRGASQLASDSVCVRPRQGASTSRATQVASRWQWKNA